MNIAEKFSGCFVGLACGDAFGAPFEGGIIERMLWKLIGKTKDGRKRYTDDTQMSIDTARSVLHRQSIDQQDLAQHFAESYRWSRGYGPGAARTLKLIGKGVAWAEANRARFPGGSFGNGAAMRAPIVALFFNNDLEATRQAVKKTGEITHPHPEALEGALLVGLAVQGALAERSVDEIHQTLVENSSIEIFRTRIEKCFSWLSSREIQDDQTVAKALGNGISAKDSCITAIYLGLSGLQQSFADLLQRARSIGGDVDTIGAMAGAIWGAYNGLGKIPDQTYGQVEDIEEILKLSENIFKFHQDRLR